ncbi:MAG: hypothetical protein WC581_00995 [Thermodesulfovibrionales bacterium]
MNVQSILETIKRTESPLKKQLLTAGLITKLLENIGKDAPLEIVELGEGLSCRIIGIEDLIIDRLNACKYWKSQIDCEMSELLVNRYASEMDWDYMEKKAAKPGNNTLPELSDLRKKIKQ